MGTNRRPRPSDPRPAQPRPQTAWATCRCGRETWIVIGERPICRWCEDRATAHLKDIR
jgi:hypothetical protein